MKLKPAKILLVLLSFYLLASCAGEDPVYLFRDGMKIRLLRKDNGKSAVYYFRKNEKPLLADSDLSFRAYICKAESPVVFSILLDKGNKNITLLPAEGENIIYFTVPEGNTLQGFSVESSAEDLLLPYIDKIDQTVNAEVFSGMKREEGSRITTDAFCIKTASDRDVFSLDIPDDGSRCCEIVADFNYQSDSHTDDLLDIVITGNSGGKYFYEYSPLYGRNNIILNSRLFGFFPVSVEISAKRNSVELVSLYADTENCSFYEQKQFVPIRTGFGSILLADRSSWRKEEYELYSWNYFPDFLIIDTADYSFQARMFKRLAFYVEKPGSRGIIRTNEEIENLHGWNAHDYKAEDLASFFNKVEEADIPLNDEEILLRQILLENHVIGKNLSEYLPGNGGILSVSRESSGYLRRIFITHEGYHGVFFSSPEFRTRCSSVWENVDPELKEFWKLFFEYKRYDTDDQYLLVNEFMAYNLQQPSDRVIPYYFDHIIPRLVKRYPEKEEFLKKITEEKEELFIYHAEKLASALFEVTSLPSGSLILLNMKKADQ